MRIRSRAVRVLTATALVLGGTTAATGASAAEAPVTVQSCYGSGKSFTTTNKVWPAYPNWAYTTSNCADINIRPNVTVQVQTCWKDHSCNKLRTIRAGEWGLAATDVYDGSRFYLKFDRNVSGTIAY
ncbi:hypothetical protein GCM10010420_05050 [Streptomyces glaucosporus]|uniref:Uncharacterized protein n=1 Tax=Streptomyces glaucosporus TaxID=284044 RepID=A0ABN3HQR0_9ACTN